MANTLLINFLESNLNSLGLSVIENGSCGVTENTGVDPNTQTIVYINPEFQTTCGGVAPGITKLENGQCFQCTFDGNWQPYGSEVCDIVRPSFVENYPNTQVTVPEPNHNNPPSYSDNNSYTPETTTSSASCSKGWEAGKQHCGGDPLSPDSLLAPFFPSSPENNQVPTAQPTVLYRVSRNSNKGDGLDLNLSGDLMQSEGILTGASLLCLIAILYGSLRAIRRL